MSIATRIISMEQHIGNAYDKLDELGVDLTNVDKNLNNITDLLDGVYEEYPKIEENDVTEPSINNTKAGKMEIDLKGNTEQNTYTGKNLLQLSHGNESKNGITYIENADGSITLNGTSTAGGAFNSTINLTLPAGTYTHSTTIPLAAGLYFSLNNQNYSMLKKDDSSITFTLNAETTFISYIIWIDSGYTVNNLTLYPQLEVGSTATSFEPYVGKTASPNPDFPQDVEVVTGENTIVIENGDKTQEQRLSLNLGSIELCKIGDYKDYPWKDESTGKWYVKKLTGKGNADDLSVIVSVTSTIGADLYAYACNVNSNINSIATLGSVISNIFTPRILGSTSETTNPNNVRFNMGISKHTSTAQIVISILKTYLNDGQTQTFKTFLQNNNFMFRYILATPTDIEITDTTLISQLNALEKAKSYDDTTNIIQENNDLPFILDVITLSKEAI